MKKMLSLAVAAGLCFGALPVHAKTRYTLERLNGAANLLQVIADEAGGNPARQWCNLTSPQAGALSVPLKARIDVKITSMTKSKKPPISRETLKSVAKNCQKRCSCGVYEKVLAPYYEQDPLYAKIREQAAAMTTEQARQCAKNDRWFCKSPLRKELEREVKISE